MAAIAELVSAVKPQPIPLNAGTNAGISALPFVVTDDRGIPVKNATREWPSYVTKVPLPFVDTGVFINDLRDDRFLPWKLDRTEEISNAMKVNPEQVVHILHQQRDELAATGDQWQVKEATYRTTQLKLMKAYELIETRYKSFMDVANFEPAIPSAMPLEKRRQFYTFTGSQDIDRYPPHLNLATRPPSLSGVADNQSATLDPAQIFDRMRLAQLSSLLPAQVPVKFIDDPLKWGEQKAQMIALKAGQVLAEAYFGSMGTPDKGKTIADVWNYNKEQRAITSSFFHHKDIFDKDNIGDLSDWFTDARFAQQQFTGTNPTTITNATQTHIPWIDHFINAAAEQKLDKVEAKLRDRSSKNSLYVQDYSYFRSAAGVPDDAILFYTPSGSDVTRYGVAAVCLFDLEDAGQLHPLAIITDWRGSADKSITIFNKKVDRSDTVNEEQDWPWRYAKTCVQTSDWLRHELTVHLTNTHLIEEATIVGANRSFEMSHMVYQLLYPHWQKTLSVNAAARDTLIPAVIVPLVGMADSAVYKFVRSAYKEFDFEGSYIPKDLEKRGFPVAELNSWKFHNYAWARTIHSMWYKIRGYVAEMLTIQYGPEDNARDAKVQNDVQVQRWVEEMHNGAAILTFPNLTSFSALVDCVTMCIHLASPQHTSINYLQNYYQAFVINKPPALYDAPPTRLEQLQAFAEPDLVRALPINHSHDWLLASHIPYLLSAKPGDKESLIIYAASKFHLHVNKSGPNDKAIADAAAKFYMELADSEQEFKAISEQCDDRNVIVYDVLSPSWNAVSILL